MLILIDKYTREYLALKTGVLIKSERVRQIFEKVCLEKSFSEIIRLDNSVEFTGKVVDDWLERQ